MGITESKEFLSKYSIETKLKLAGNEHCPVFREEKLKYRLLAEKTFNTVEMACSNEEFGFMCSRCERLPFQFYKARITGFNEAKKGFCNPEMAFGTAYFESCSTSLHKIVTKEGSVFTNIEILHLIKEIARSGSHLQDNLEFFPRVSLKEIFCDSEGIRYSNPYIFDQYVAFSLKVASV